MKSITRITAYIFIWALYCQGIVRADDTDIYVNASSTGNEPYLMLMMDYRSDLAGPFCSSCKAELDSEDEFPLLQALYTLVNGIPGDEDGDGDVDPADVAAITGLTDQDGDTDVDEDDARAFRHDSDGDGYVDSAANMDEFDAKRIQALVAVLAVVFEKFNDIYVGMMFVNHLGGATVMRGYKQFMNNDTNGAKSELAEILMRIPWPFPGGGTDYNKSQPKETYYEWYRYINGGEVLFGGEDYTVDNFPAGPPRPTPDPSVIGDDGNYISPFDTDTPEDFECTNFYSIYATSGNEDRGSDGDADEYIEADLSSDAASNFSNLLDYMSDNDVLVDIEGETGTQTLKTWVAFAGSGRGTTPEDWAIASGTDDQFIKIQEGVDLTEVQRVIESIFIEALSVSTTFVSASVPVNVFNRVQTLDNFYIALFEAESLPRWPGNLKKLKMSDTDSDGVFDEIVDARGSAAFNNEDGRIKYESLTFWTDASELPAADPQNSEVINRDGRSVMRGGAGQKIPGFIGTKTIGDRNSNSTRNVYYEPATGNSLAINLDADNTTANELRGSNIIDSSLYTRNQAVELIRWIRGQDIDNEDNDNSTDVRPWLLGDAIHSRPLAINYGARGSYTETNPDIRIFMGSNDGMFHSFKNTGTSGTDSGEEAFAFIPLETFGNFSILRENREGQTHPYGVDGPATAYVEDVNSDGTIDHTAGDKVYVYFGLRRGGKTYYALDVSNPDAAPTFMFKVTTGNGSGDFGELSLSFAKPVVGKVRYNGSVVNALFITGGYDSATKDGDGHGSDGSAGADATGNAIYVVNAETGELIWKVRGAGTTGAVNNSDYTHASMLNSFPSDVTTLDADRNGVIDRLYVGDTGGRVWRVDLPEGYAADTNFRQNNWEATVLANLLNTDTRFFHRPDVVQTMDGNGAYDGVALVSGDRANPLETSDGNRMYYVKDRNTTSGAPSTTPIAVSDLTDVTSCPTGCSGATYRSGWFFDLTDSGEKGLSSPLIADGHVFFTSYIPNTGGGACQPAEGNGKVYVTSLSDGSAALNTIFPDAGISSSARGTTIGPGIPPDPTAVGGDLILLPGAGVDGQNLLPNINRSVFKIYWRATGKDSI